MLQNEEGRECVKSIYLPKAIKTKVFVASLSAERDFVFLFTKLITLDEVTNVTRICVGVKKQVIYC